MTRPCGFPAAFAGTKRPLASPIGVLLVNHSTLPARLPSLSLNRLADVLQDRLQFAKLAGLGVWLAWFVSLALGGWTHDVMGHPAGADHVQYFIAGGFVADGRSELIYDVDTMATHQAELAGEKWDGVLPFRYPPFYAICFAFTSFLPYIASWLLWAAIGVVGLSWAADALGVEDKANWLIWAFCFYPVFAAISFGQNSLISLAILAWTFALLRGGRPYLAGVVAGLLLFKPQLLVGITLLWLFDYRRSWRALLGLATTGAVLLRASIVFVPGASRRFIENIGEITQMASPHSMSQLYSTQGFWNLLLPHLPEAAAFLSLACSILGIVALFVVWRRFQANLPVRFAAAVLLTLWISPYAMVYDWSLLLIPATLLWHHVPAQRRLWGVLFAAIWVASLVSGPLVRGQELLLPFAVQISVPVLAVVLVVAWRALRRPALA